MRCAVVVPAFMIEIPTLFGVVGKAETLRGRTRHGNSRVDVGMVLVGTAHREPHRAELRLHASAVRFSGFDHLLALGLVGHRLELAILRDPIEIRDARALDGERLTPRFTGSVVAGQAIGALLQRLVGVVGIPLDDRGFLAHLPRRRGERALDGVGRRRLCKRAARDGDRG